MKDYNLNLNELEVDCDHLDGKMFLYVENKTYRVMVEFVEDHRNKKKWMEWFYESNIFDKDTNS